MGKRSVGERGAVAVEGAFVTAFLLVPLIFGLLYYGDYFWQAQKVPNLSADPFANDDNGGTYTCQQLTDRLKAALAGDLSSLAAQLGVPENAIHYTISAINRVPGASVGVTVTTQLTVDVGGLGIAPVSLPLPDGGGVTQSITSTLPNTALTTVSC